MEPLVREGYDVMQVCLNGHRINASAHSMPQFNSDYCAKCGAKTITECPRCATPIRGRYHNPGVLSVAQKPPPNNCHQCGSAFPWRIAEIAAVVEVLQMNLEDEDAAKVPELVQQVATETPSTQVASLRLKNLLGKMGKAAYDISVKVVSDVASETAKKILRLVSF